MLLRKSVARLRNLQRLVLHIMKKMAKTLSMKRKNGFTERIHVAILSSICSVMNVKRVTVSVKKCPTSATPFSMDAT